MAFMVCFGGLWVYRALRAYIEPDGCEALGKVFYGFMVSWLEV